MGIFRICQKRDGTRTAFFDFCKRGYGYISIAFNYATGENAAVMDNLPQTELLRDRNMEILYLTDQADQMLAEILREYKEKPFRSALDGDLDLEDMPEEKNADDYKEALDFVKEALGGGVDEVRVSRKLKTHPVCLTSGEGMSFEMERYFNAVQPEMGMKAKRILEVNVDHPAFAALEAGGLIVRKGKSIAVIDPAGLETVL